LPISFWLIVNMIGKIIIRKVLIFGIGLLGLLVHQVNAQILNIESFRLEKDTAKVFLGNVGFGFSAKKQTVSVSRYNSNVNSVYLSQQHSYMLLSTLSLVKIDNQNVLSEGYAHYRMNFFRKKIFSTEQFNQIQYDKGRGMDSRLLTGLCLRYRILNTPRWSISANTGLMYEIENWSNAHQQQQSHLVKSSSNLTIKAKITPTLSLYMITYYQARPDQYFFRPRLITDTSLQLKISTKFSFNTQYVATYDDRPIIDIPHLIYAVNSSILYNF
jgi:putative salt-induced outer membrane protein YdiY